MLFLLSSAGQVFFRDRARRRGQELLGHREGDARRAAQKVAAVQIRHSELPTHGAHGLPLSRTRNAGALISETTNSLIDSEAFTFASIPTKELSRSTRSRCSAKLVIFLA